MLAWPSAQRCATDYGLAEVATDRSGKLGVGVYAHAPDIRPLRRRTLEFYFGELKRTGSYVRQRTQEKFRVSMSWWAIPRHGS